MFPSIHPTPDLELVILPRSPAPFFCLCYRMISECLVCSLILGCFYCLALQESEPGNICVYGIYTYNIHANILTYMTMHMCECHAYGHFSLFSIVMFYTVATHIELENTKPLLRGQLRGCAKLCLVTQSCPTLCDPMDCSPSGSSVHGDFPGKNTGVACHALLQGIFPTQGSSPGKFFTV